MDSKIDRQIDSNQTTRPSLTHARPSTCTTRILPRHGRTGLSWGYGLARFSHRALLATLNCYTFKTYRWEVTVNYGSNASRQVPRHRRGFSPAAAAATG